MKKSRKILVTILAVVVVFAFASTAYAGAAGFANQPVYGGASQKLITNGSRGVTTISFRVDTVDFRRQTNWLYRGYIAYSSTTCSQLTSLPGIGTYTSTYTSRPDYVDVKSSIASGSGSDYLIFSGGMSY